MTEEKKVLRRKSLAKWLKESILRLGPTFIKIGQQFSTRVDILAQEYVDQLSELQDQVPPFPSETAISIIEEELGAPLGDIFDRFDYEPIAAASLGQVHRARLKGQEVVVKVQRPGLKDLFDIDLKNLRVIAEYLQKVDPKTDGAKRDWVAIYDECASVLYEEIDYTKEAANAELFAKNFESMDYVKVPNIYWDYTTPQVLAHPSAAASLTRLNLLAVASSDGFRSSELLAVVSACRNLRQFLVPCVFNPRYIDFVGDDALIAVAAACPQLSLLHLVDPATLAPARSDTTVPAPNPEDAGITGTGLAALFAALPQLEDLALDPCHHIRGAGPSLESLGPRIRSLKLGYFHGICTAVGLHLDGVAVCGRLESLCINNCPDITDASLVNIARGCRRLSKFQIHGSGKVTEMGIKKLAGMLRPTLIDVSISNCSNFDATVTLRALEPIRECIESLHIDCIWVKHGLEKSHEFPDHQALDDEFEQDIHSGDSGYPLSKKCRFSVEAADHWMNGDNCSSTRCRIWDRLKFLSLWVPAGELLSPLLTVGLEICPSLEEICIKVEGDCRTCPRPVEPFFGLSFLAQYPELVKMKLDCGEAIGYALTAPTGHIDLSQWERFYLHGIGDLNLQELDYWPPQDREVNQRSLTLPATSLIQGCITLRKLFIHGTTHEHFLRFFLKMPRLRDVQLREDYYPAPENDMSTEMRVGSCSRFEDALNNRPIPD